MAFEGSTPQSGFNLPRRKGVSYAAQDAWVMAETVKNNITFGSPWDTQRYKMVLKQCALEKDLEIFAAGDGMFRILLVYNALGPDDLIFHLLRNRTG